MIISMVMAMDRNKLIGSNGGMPWNLPSEQQYFKRVTMGKPMIMGRKTYESIGRPLPGRTSIVITRNQNWPQSGEGKKPQQDFLSSGQLRVVTSLDEAIAAGRDILGEPASESSAQAKSVEEAKEVAVIGGAAICELAMPLCQRLYLTVIDAEFTGDTWLTSFEREEWSLVSETPASTDGYELSYQVLERS